MEKLVAPKGISHDIMCKADSMCKGLLKQYTQEASIALPVYQTSIEKTPRGTHYRSQVWVDGICFKPPYTFLNKRMAKDGAARHVLIDILEKLKSDKAEGILEDTTFCKSIVNEYFLKMNRKQKISLNKKPTYTTESTKALIPMFISSLDLNGATYVGKPAKIKREAEKLAACSAILSILDSKFNRSYRIMSMIVKSKFKFYDKLKKVKNLNRFQACTTNVVSGVDGATVAEIPQPSPVVPSGQVPDVNEPLKSAVKRAPDTTSQAQPEFSQVFKKRKLKVSASSIAPELVVPHIELVLPASESAQTSTKKKRRKKNEGKVHLPPLSVATISHSSPPVAMSGALLLNDKNNEAHGVDGSAVGEIPQPIPLVPSSQVPDVIQNVLLEAAVKLSPEATAQDQPECIHAFKKPELLQASTSAAALPTELVIPRSEEMRNRKRKNLKKKNQQRPQSPLPIDSSGLISVVDKSNESHDVDGGAAAEISQLISLVQSGHVPDVNQNGPMESAVKRALDTNSQSQPESSQVFKRRKLKALTSAIAPESVVPHIELVPPASEPAAASAINKYRNKNKGKVHQPPLSVAMISQSSPSVAMSGALLSGDRNNEAHGVDGAVVGGIPQPSPLVPSSQVLDVNQNVLLESAVKLPPEETAQDQPESIHVFKKPELFQAATSAVAPPIKLVIPRTELVPPAQGPASIKKNRKKKKCQLPQSPLSVSVIDSTGLLSVVDKNNEAHDVDGSAVAEISQRSPLVLSENVPDVNEPLKSAVKQVPDTTSQAKSDIKDSTSANAPELVVPHIEPIPPPVPAQGSSKMKSRKNNKAKIHQPLLSVAMIDSSGLLSVVDKTNETHDVDGSAVAEVSQPSPLVLSGNVPDVNEPLKSAVKQAPDTTSQAQPELKASTSAISPHIEPIPPASEPAPVSTKDKYCKTNKGKVHQPPLSVAMISQISPPVPMNGTLLSVDKNIEAHDVDGSAVVEILQPSPLVPSSQVPDVNQNVLLESAVKRAPDTTAQDQPEHIHVFKKPELSQASTSGIPPPTEFVPPASEQAPAFGKNDLTGSMIAQSPAPVAVIAQGPSPSFAYSMCQ